MIRQHVLLSKHLYVIKGVVLVVSQVKFPQWDKKICWRYIKAQFRTTDLLYPAWSVPSSAAAACTSSIGLKLHIFVIRRGRGPTAGCRRESGTVERDVKVAGYSASVLFEPTLVQATGLDYRKVNSCLYIKFEEIQFILVLPLPCGSSASCYYSIHVAFHLSLSVFFYSYALPVVYIRSFICTLSAVIALNF